MKELKDSRNIMNGQWCEHCIIILRSRIKLWLSDFKHSCTAIFCVFARPCCEAVSERGAVRAVGADTGAHLVNVMNPAQ